MVVTAEAIYLWAVAVVAGASGVWMMPKRPVIGIADRLWSNYEQQKDLSEILTFCGVAALVLGFWAPL